MVDINHFREHKGGNPDIIRESQRRRHEPVEIVDEIIELDKKHRDLKSQQNTLNREKREVSQQFKGADDAKKTELRDRSNKIKAEQETVNAEISTVEKALDDALYTIGNLVHESVPVSDNEDDNDIIRTFGECKSGEGLMEHDELLWRIGGCDPEMGSRVAGHRGYYLIGPAFWLNQALIQYGFHYLHKHGFQHVQVPFFMKKEIMREVAQLEDYDESLYKVTGEGNEENYLIATSEQPLCAYHQNKNINPKTLPLKYCGYSTNFRKEAGSSGRDIRGIFRVHQFEKVEQFVVADPEKSWEMHEELMEISEGYYKALGLSYQVVAIVSAELNNAAAKKYDLEAWFPCQGKFRELVSNSNCTDYQARRLNCKYNIKQNGEVKFCHMLNSTLVASERTLCCVLENYQTPEGIKIPEVLKPYLAPYVGDADIIPFVRDDFVRDKKKGKKKN